MPQVSPYAYAKACGILSKSFVGKRLSFLGGVQSLNDLDRLLFPNQYSELPQRALLISIEKKIIERAVRGIFSIVNAFEKPPELIVRMIRAYEYNNLKTCLQNIAGGIEAPFVSDIGRFGTVNFNAYPDLPAMIKNTEFENVLNPEMDVNEAELKIDHLYYEGLLLSLEQLSGEDRQAAERIIKEEIILRNCTYALRLRTYYHKKTEEIENHLIKVDDLAEEAIKLCELPLDVYHNWEGWKWKKLLNAEHSSAHWKADPRHFQNAASLYLYKLAYTGFRRNPMSISSIFCFIKIKQFEEDILTSITEGLALGMNTDGVFSMLEVA